MNKFIGKSCWKEIYTDRNLYYNYLTTCNNPGNRDERVKPSNRSSRNRFEQADRNLEIDFTALVDSAKRHSKCN